MAHAQLDNVWFSYPDKDILQEITWRIDDATKVGLVGKNGTGKTTLLNIITGSLTPDKGTVYRSRDLIVGYLKQHYGSHSAVSLRHFLLEAFAELATLSDKITSLESEMAKGHVSPDVLQTYGALQADYELRGGYTFEARMKSIVAGLGFTESILDRPLNQLSGGEANRAALARLLLEEPNLLVLDEPTNHLDIEAIEWLEEYLKTFKGGLVMVTHDRYFLDKTVTQIVELHHQKLDFYYGNYSAYVVDKETRQEQNLKAYRQQQAFINKTEDFIRKNIAGQKTKQAKSRIKVLTKLERVDRPVSDGKAMAVRFDTDHYGGFVLLEFNELGMNFGGRTLLHNVNLEVMRGDKIGLIGPNGSGKSTLLHIIRGSLACTSGSMTLGFKAHLGYYDQHLRAVDPDKTILEDFMDTYPTLTNYEARSFLGRFLFTGEEVFKPNNVLSGGETSRLALAKIMFARPNLLLLDEPTNHLDVASREMLEEALIEFNGTMILVSHDRYLLDRVSTKTWYLHDEGIREYYGNYSEFREARARELAYVAETPTAKAESASQSANRRASKKEIRQKRAEDRKKFGHSAAHLENQIQELERKLQDVRLAMTDDAHGSNWELLLGLHNQESALEQEIVRLMELWELALERENDEN